MRTDKTLFTEAGSGEPVAIEALEDENAEAMWVAGQIMQKSKKRDYSDFAILYRTNAQSYAFEKAFISAQIPYKIIGGVRFYDRKEVKDVISYFRLAVNPHDEEAFKRVLNYPARGIGDTTLNKIVSSANTHGVSLWKVIQEPLTYGLNINKGTHAKLQGFVELIEGFIKDALEKNAYEVGNAIVRMSGIMSEMYQDHSPENLSRRENIEELVNGMHDFCTTRQEEGDEHILLTDYLAEVSLLTDQDNENEADGSKVTLMTIHSAKGLEFKNVFVVGLEENLFPSPMNLDSMRGLEEERRLFYVAITRAEEHCFLSFAKSRFKFGKTEFSNPSRFLKDIDVCYLRIPQEAVYTRQIEQNASSFRAGVSEYANRYAKPERPKVELIRPAVSRNLTKVSNTTSRPTSSGTQTTGLQTGNVIEHERFGVGKVVQVEGVGDNCKATVEFQHAGVKQLLLKFARFKVIG